MEAQGRRTDGIQPGNCSCGLDDVTRGQARREKATLGRARQERRRVASIWESSRSASLASQGHLQLLNSHQKRRLTEVEGTDGTTREDETGLCGRDIRWERIVGGVYNPLLYIPEDYSSGM